MSQKNIDTTLPKMAAAVKEILKEHKNEKGIIHCHSYKIAKYLKQNIKSSRLMLHNSENRDKILWRHMNEKKATVLLSPSMSEGVDLKGDISRFQIICKWYPRFPNGPQMVPHPRPKFVFLIWGMGISGAPKCSQVYSSVHRCSQKYPGVPKRTQVCAGVLRCVEVSLGVPRSCFQPPSRRSHASTHATS